MSSPSTNTFNSVFNQLCIRLEGPLIPHEVLIDTNRTVLGVNDQLVNMSLVELNESTICTISGGQQLFQDGENNIFFFSKLEQKYPIILSETVYAGMHIAKVTLVDSISNIFQTESTVTATLASNPVVKEEIKTSDGTGCVIFEDLSSETIVLTAQTNKNEFGTMGVIGGSNVTIMIVSFDENSGFDNKDFSLELKGWNTLRAAAIELIPIDEITEAIEPNSRNRFLGLPTPKFGCRLSTGGKMGESHASYTFRTPEEPSVITIQYQFQTDEFLGGYYGSKYNDYYSVSVRAHPPGDLSVIDNPSEWILVEQSSMNSFPKSAFDNSSGTTELRSLSFVKPRRSESVQVDFVVANVRDHLYDSSIIIYGLAESCGAESCDADISSLSLFSGQEGVCTGKSCSEIFSEDLNLIVAPGLPTVKHDIGSGKHGSLNPWLFPIIYREYLVLKGDVWVYCAMPFALSDACVNLKHYLLNTGKDLTINIDSMNENEDFRKFYNEKGKTQFKRFIIQSLLPRVKEGTFQIRSLYPMSFYHKFFDDLNWYAAVGGASYYSQGTVTVTCLNDSCTKRLVHVVHHFWMQDKYNWDVPIPGIPDVYFGLFHRFGLAQEFLVYGKLTNSFVLRCPEDC